MRPLPVHYFSEKNSVCPLHIDDYALFGQIFVKAPSYCDLDSDRKTQLPVKDNCVLPKGLRRLWGQFELIAAVGDGADGVARAHLPAELADDVGHSRAAVLRELMPYSLVDLFLRENPAGVPGQIGQREVLS